MPPKLTKAIIGAGIAVALAAAVSYGLINQQTADQLQTKANQTLQDDQTPAGSAQPPTPPQNSVPQAPAQPGASPQPPAPAPRP
ncbi:hypothetical protein [Methylobacterium sp. J-076]|uniref:hypothetical protein n=1 Tax=Methylobacterium sp. J-076 TaxID=2836655 RepID=UPI001FBA3E04|nr:hypothetical protein [Methylobacterium sp. J-076]MCJ2013572.1 hypothetical protein [Methylobacterium sp. J-076]